MSEAKSAEFMEKVMCLYRALENQKQMELEFTVLGPSLAYPGGLLPTGSPASSVVGVVGVSRSPGLGSPTAPVPDPADGLGIGVLGTSGKGPGVRGSSQSGEGGQFESESGVGATGTSDSGAGVSGRSGSGVGVIGTSDSSIGVRGSSDSGTGVSGRSGSGIGVTGRSASNRGGLFSSAETIAQIHLVPHRQQPETPLAELPKNGRVGDLIVIRSTGTDPEGVSFDLCSLWLCTPKESSEEESDQWTEVVLGGTVTGTL